MLKEREERVRRIIQERLGNREEEPVPQPEMEIEQGVMEGVMEGQELEVYEEEYVEEPVRRGTQPMPRLPRRLGDWFRGRQAIDVPADGFNYWIPRPSLRGWRVVGFLTINLATATGLCCFAILGFAFEQIGQMGELQWWLTLAGSVSLAIGSEVGTFVTVIEIFRKVKMAKQKPVLARVLISILTTARAVRVVIDALTMIYKEPVDKSFDKAMRMIDQTLGVQDRGAVLWDWIGLVISACTSLSAVALAQVSILQLAGADVSYVWLPVIQQWSPVLLALFGVLDGYINHGEYGLFLASFDERVKEWYKNREAAKKEMEKKYWG